MASFRAPPSGAAASPPPPRSLRSRGTLKRATTNPFPPHAAARLRSETFVRTVEAHHELPSTNDRALRLIKESPALPALVLAARQTAGRGRGAHRWTAPPGALTFTLLIAPPEGLNDVAPLAPLTGLAVAEWAAARTPHEVAVKWPNDVLLRPGPLAPWGKLAGVLCERPAPGPVPDNVVAVGVGVNLNCDPAAFPADLPRPAASLRGAHDPHDPVAALVDLLVRWEAAFGAFSAGGRLDPTRWAPRDALAGRAVTIDAGSTTLRGTACGITAGGALRLFDGAAVREVRSGSVEW